MGKKIYIVENEKLEYVANIDDVDDIVLQRSESERWSEHVRGEKVGSVVDTGNDLQLKVGEHSLTLDYDEFHELSVLVNLKRNVDSNFIDSKFLQEL